VGGETTLSGVDGFSVTLSYAVGGEQLFVNGVLLERGVDYTATSGTSIALSNALVLGDLATVVSQNTFAIANAIPLSTVTAKGDLIAANGSGTVTNLAVGADGTTLVANSSAGGGVSWAGPNVAAGKNIVIGGGFDIWQRGTSFVGQNSLGSAYWADRWSMYFGSSPNNWTLSRQATNDSTNLPNIQYCARIQRNAGATTLGGTIGTSIEIANSIPFASKSVTLSYWARKGSNYSEPNSQVTYTLKSGTGSSDANGIYNTYTGQTNVVNGQSILTTTWQRFSYTGTVSSTATQLAISIDVGYSGTAGTNDYVEITGVQVELGSVATPFSRAGGTLQGELAACQRYYWRGTYSSAYGGIGGNGFTFSTTQANMQYQVPVPMRTYPTSYDLSNIRVGDSANSAFNITSISFWGTASSATNTALVDFQAIGTGFTSGRYVFLQTSSGGGYIGFSAEL
jgi:hypothetical protein